MKNWDRWFPALKGLNSGWRGDLTGGLTLAAVAVPGAMAAAQLVGVSPAHGLVGLVVAAVVFAVTGAHRTLSVGPDSSIAPMLAAGAVAAAGNSGASDDDSSAGLMMISLMVAALLLAVGLVRGGWITQFLSRPVTTGLMAGIGISIVFSQLPTIAGSEDPAEANLYSIGLGAGVLALSLGLSLISPRFPSALIALAAAMAAAWLLNLEDRGVEMLPAPEAVWHVPDLHDLAGLPWGAWWDLLPTAAVIVVLVVAQTGATEEATRQGQHTLDRDLAAIGVASAASSLAGAFAVNASPPRTSLIQDLRGKTQLISLSAAAVALVALLFGEAVLPLVPEAALAAVLIQIAVSLIRVGELRRIAAFSKVELGVALGTVVLVVVLGIVEGTAVAALITLLDRTRREARPAVYRKGLIPQSNHWVPVDAGVETVQVPSVLVWSVEAPLWYADADYVTRRLHEELEREDYSVVVLDAAAISDLDYSGVRALDTLVDHIQGEGVPVLIARPNRVTQKALAKSGIEEKVRTHPTVADAVKDGARMADLKAEFRAARGKKKDLAALADAGLNQEELMDQEDPEAGKD